MTQGKTLAERSYTVDDFPGVEVESIEKLYANDWLVVKLKNNNEEAGLDAAVKIGKLDFVESAFINNLVIAQSATPREVSVGDVNLDWKIDVTDAREALRRSIGLEADCYNNNADIDKNGEVTVADARIILRMAIGLE